MWARYTCLPSGLRAKEVTLAWFSLRVRKNLPVTLLPRRGWVPLYKLSANGRSVLEYETAVAEKGTGLSGIPLFGSFLLVSGVLGLAYCLRNRSRYTALVSSGVDVEAFAARHGKKSIRKRLTIGMSVALYALIVGVNFYQNVQAKFAEAFGATAFGMPIIVTVTLVQTLLYLPVPWFIWHLAAISDQAYLEGHRTGILYLFRAGAEHPHLRRSQGICLIGFLYFLSISMAWIVYTAAKGI